MQKNNVKKKLSIVIPVYNEEATLSTMVQRILDADALGLQKEIIIIDDCSDDSSVRIARSLQKKAKIHLHALDKNQGKGNAITQGFMLSTGDIVIIQDADLEYSPDDYPAMIRPIMDGYADVVFGSRFINANPHRVLFFYHYIGNKLITLFSNMMTNLNLTDIETGYKAFRGDIIRRIAPDLQSKGFGIEAEITSRVAKIPGIRIYEVGISYFGRTYQEGKKIGWKDAVVTFIAIVKYHFFP